jgi:hypothetical protein
MIPILVLVPVEVVIRPSPRVVLVLWLVVTALTGALILVLVVIRPSPRVVLVLWLVVMPPIGVFDLWCPIPLFCSLIAACCFIPIIILLEMLLVG